MFSASLPAFVTEEYAFPLVAISFDFCPASYSVCLGQLLIALPSYTHRVVDKGNI